MSNDQRMISSLSLLRGSIAAVLLAGITLVTIILPAEYDIDPLGTGRALGLTEIAAAADKPAVPVGDTAVREDELYIDIAPGKGLEYKLHMKPGQKVLHSWSVEGGDLYFDFHGEPTGDTTGYYESFAESTASGMNGLFYAPFDGSHGWYWRNKNEWPLTIKLKLKGEYEIIGLKQ